MKYRKILLMSSAVIISTYEPLKAIAADVVVAEPEPVEYMRVCDVYGEGFIYIPGTETCLKLSGYVQIDYQSRQYHKGWSTTPKTHRHGWSYEANLAVEAQNETEWGTLRSELSFTGGEGAPESSEDVFSGIDPTFRGSGDGALAIDAALISLAGFQLGYGADYWQTSGDDGYFNAINDGIYGEGSATFLQYTYASDGIALTAGIQAAASFDEGGTGLAGQPDIYTGSSFSGDWGRIYGLYYHDASVARGAWKAGVELDMSSTIPSGGLKGWYMSDNGGTNYVHGHAWGVSTQMKLSEKFVLYAGYSDYDWDETGQSWASANDLSATDFSVGVLWNVTDGLEILAEYNKRNYDYQVVDDRVSVDSINLRVIRSF